MESMSDETYTGNYVAVPAGAAEAQVTQGSLITTDEFVLRLAAEAGTVPEIAEYVDRPTPPLLVILTGPSGVGKDVTLERLKEVNHFPFHYAVTVTTRKQRQGEIDGEHYIFVSPEEYRRMIDNDELLEHSEIYGNSYGIPKSQVVDWLRRGYDVIMKPDVQGARKIRALEPEALSIFLAPPNMEEQARRLYYRKTEDPQELARRMKDARAEMHELANFDYFVVNHSNRLDDTVRTILAILTAEKSKVHPRRIRLADAPDRRL